MSSFLLDPKASIFKESQEAELSEGRQIVFSLRCTSCVTGYWFSPKQTKPTLEFILVDGHPSSILNVKISSCRPSTLLKEEIMCLVSSLNNTCLMFIKVLSKHQIVNRLQGHYKYYSLVATHDNLVAPKALETVKDDMSNVTPNFQSTFNIAAYVNRSETLQNLVHLNVNLNKIENKPQIAEKFLRLDFEKDMKKHILFIQDYVAMEGVGDFITKNPMIFFEDLNDLNTRVNYLTSKHFMDSQIKRIISKNPFWLSFSTVRIDRRFGYFQECFELSGKEVRYLATKQPTIITYNLHHIKSNLFAIKEEMGFKDHEVKSILLEKPKVFMLNQRALLERFNYIHNVIKVDHKTILDSPQVLLCRAFRLKQRHLFLGKMGRAQYDPKKENYVPITALIKDTDSEFCNTYAKCNVSDYNIFLKTL